MNEFLGQVEEEAASILLKKTPNNFNFTYMALRWHHGSAWFGSVRFLSSTDTEIEMVGF